MPHRIDEAIEILERFADRTGVTSDRTPQRYLWTDAFAVCTLLGLSRATGERRLLELALRLIDAVHTTLGRHRDDDPRKGWLSGLDDAQAAQHPTAGGLRIGKPQPEGSPYEVIDTTSEWERDGQYFHYLTKWMHALDQTTRATGEWRFNVWARELADRAFNAFTYRLDGTDELRIHWKMSVDLSRPTVRTMGQHDPLDGYVTYVQIESTATAAPLQLREPHVDAQADELASAVDLSSLHTADPLGIGGLLFDAARIEQLVRARAFRDESLTALVLAAAGHGLAQFMRDRVLERPADRRLPFRELGLAIGLHALDLIAEIAADDRLRESVGLLDRYSSLAAEIEDYWRDPAHREAATWTAHRDINDVMLAAALAPHGMIALERVASR